MDEIEFVSLFEIEEQLIVDLMNNSMVSRYLPLLNEGFTAEDCRNFLESKKRLWDAYGYGPYAILIEGAFAGWGGLQYEDGEVDFALVLHPRYWGWGMNVFLAIKELAFHQMGIESITALLPLGRHNAKAIKRFGFIEEGLVDINDEQFFKYRLSRP